MDYLPPIQGFKKIRNIILEKCFAINSPALSALINHSLLNAHFLSKRIYTQITRVHSFLIATGLSPSSQSTKLMSAVIGTSQIDSTSTEHII